MIEIKRKSQKPAESAEMPLKGAEAQKAGEHLPDNKPALKGQQTPFRSIDGKWDYRAMYEDAYKYHKKYQPPVKDETGEYWIKACEELTQLAGKYPYNEFFQKWLVLIFEELEREYKKLGGQE